METCIRAASKPAVGETAAPDDSAAQGRQGRGGAAHAAKAVDDRTGSVSWAALIFALGAAALFLVAGISMLIIGSEASSRGDSITIIEIFYHAMGWMCLGMSALSVALGLMGWMIPRR